MSASGQSDEEAFWVVLFQGRVWAWRRIAMPSSIVRSVCHPQPSRLCASHPLHCGTGNRCRVRSCRGRRSWIYIPLDFTLLNTHPPRLHCAVFFRQFIQLGRRGRTDAQPCLDIPTTPLRPNTLRPLIPLARPTPSTLPSNNFLTVNSHRTRMLAQTQAPAERA